MGAVVCGTSSNDFSKVEACEVADVSSRPDLIGKRVQVIGCVGHTGEVLASPFGEREGVAIKFTAMLPPVSAATDKKVLFTAVRCLPFTVTDGNKVIRVNASGFQHVQLKLTRTIHNILRDERTGGLVSGGEKQGLYSQVEERPNALQFWKDFNGGRDDPANITPIHSKHGMSGYSNRPRLAKEFILEVGDDVAVIGTLQNDGGKLVLELDNDPCITNIPNVAKLLRMCTAKPGISAFPIVSQMSAGTRASARK